MKKFFLSAVFAIIALVSFAQTPITGTFTLCVGSTTTLLNSTPGGTWSSSNVGIASIGSLTGVVTGNAAGVATITYAMGSTWFVTQDVTVNPLPTPIIGPLRLCVGDVGTLNSNPLGGTWTSGTPGVASIGSVSGIVTALSPGTTLITYTLPTGCSTTAIVTVNPLPGAITGPSSVCVGSTINLSATPPGGFWLSSLPGIASINPSTGVVTGMSAGVTIITYMLSTGCMITTPITVNPLPVIGLSTSAQICVGSTLTIPATPTGGVWVSSNTSVATIGSSSGVATGIAPGIVTITYTLPTGCFASILLTVNPNPVISGPNNVCLGSNITLTGTPAGGVWSSSPISIATVGSSSGVVTGVGTGVAVITYTLSTGCFATYSITVNPVPGPIVGSTGIPGGIALCVGATATLINGVPGGIWTSGTPTVATIGSTSGLVTALSPGTTVITYTLPGGCFVTTIVTVNPTPTAITGPTQVCAGSTISLSSTPGGGIWTSNNLPVAQVGSNTGVVTGITPGVATITYTLPGGCFVTVNITVNPVPVIGISTSARVCVGSTIVLPSTPTGGIWASSNTGIATVGSSSGIITGITPGVVTITYTLPTGCFVSFLLTVDPTPVISGPNNVCVGSSITLTGTPAGGVWTSSPISIATVGSSSGVVTGGSAGIATITYTLPTGCFATYSVTVNPVPGSIGGTVGLPGITVCVGSSLTLTNAVPGGIWTSGTPGVATVGSTSGVLTGITPGTTVITYTLPGGCFVTTIATVNPTPTAIVGPTQVCAGSSISLTSTPGGGVWSSGAPLIAGVGSISGVVTGISAGVAVITYMLPAGCFVTTTITVNPVPTIGISTSARVCVGSTITLPATPTGGIWTSGNTSIATVGSLSGVITGITPGVVMITYTLSTGCFASFLLTVDPTPTISGPNTVCAGSSITLTGTPAGGVWTSSPISVATVGSSSGVVTGGSAGVATITYTLPTGCFATYSVTVNPIPGPIGGTVGTSGPVICVGSTLTLTNPVTGGIWTSGTPGVATVGSSSGVVTGITPGTSVITYTLPGGCFVSIIVTVNPMPTAITGPSQVCVGASISLTSTPGGGVWTSGAPSIAQVGSTSGVVTGITAGVAVITYTLPGGCFVTTTITVDPVPVIGISTGTSLCVGGTLTLPSSPTGGIWTSGNTTIATVGSISGVITGLTPGVVAITYTLPTGCFATVLVTVNPTPVISGPTVVCSGNTIVLTGTPAGGIWTSGTPSVALVGSSSGVVTGVAGGTAVITYMLSTGCFAVYTITVNPTPVIGITTGVHLCAGTSLTLTATPTGGIWTSGNTTIATVGSSSGVITGVAPGLVTITYTLSTGCFTTILVTVDPTPVITGPSSVCVGGTINLTGTPGGGIWISGTPGVATVGSSSGIVTGVTPGTTVITYALPTGCAVSVIITVNPVPVITGSTLGTAICVGNTTVLVGSPTGGIWSSSNTSIATVGSTGIVTAIGPGAVTITYTLPSGCFASIVIFVMPAPSPITGITTVCVGGTTALFCPGGGTWSSGNPSVATIGSLSGIVTGISPGSAVITYTLPSGCSVTTTVNVVSGVGPITGTLSVCVGSTTTLVGPGGGIWSSGTPTVATIGSSSGVVTGVSAGTSVITYMISTGCISTAVVTVNPLPVLSGPSSLCVGNTITLTGTPPGGTYSSSNPLVATINGVTGVATGVTPGTVTITYTLPSGCSTSMTIVVNPSPGPISGPNTLCVGSVITLSGSGGGIWSSSNPAIATVTGSGLVTGVSAGVVNITYMFSTGCYSTMSVTVNPMPGPITGPAYVCVGNTVTLNCTPAGGVWTSSNPLQATVGSSTGVVTGVAVGTPTITYTLPGGCYTLFKMPVKAQPCWPAAVEDLAGKAQIVEVFPNPAYDELTIKAEQGVYSTYMISNETGQVVKTNQVRGAETTVDIRTLPPGLYFITMKGEYGNNVQKFVKM